MGTRGEVYSTKVNGEKRTFFFNVKENRNGDYFLNIVESKKGEAEGFERQQVLVYEEELEAFMRELSKAAAVVLKKRELSAKAEPRDRNDAGPARY